MQVKIELDQEAVRRLAELSAAERRPLTWQAEVLLRRALGLDEAGQLKGGHQQPGRRPGLAREARHE